MNRLMAILEVIVTITVTIRLCVKQCHPLSINDLNMYGNHLFINNAVKKSRMKESAKNDEKCSGTDLGNTKVLDMLKLFHPFNLFSTSKALNNNENVTLKGHTLENRNGLFPYESFDDINKLQDKCLPNIGGLHSTLKQCGIRDSDYQQAVDDLKDMKYKRYEMNDIKWKLLLDELGYVV